MYSQQRSYDAPASTTTTSSSYGNRNDYDRYRPSSAAPAYEQRTSYEPRTKNYPSRYATSHQQSQQTSSTAPSVSSYAAAAPAPVVVKPPPAPPAKLPPNWKEYKTDNGTPYYYNEITQKTQWEFPKN